MKKGKGEMEKVKGWFRRLVLGVLLGPFTVGLLPISFAAKSFAQTPQTEIPNPLTARTISPRFQTIGMEDGLSQAGINDMLQDRRGFMWFGTQDGLNRWDGYEMKVYKHQPFDTTTLASAWVNGLAEDEEGHIWVAANGGLSRLDPVTDEVEIWTFDPNDPEGLPSDRLGDILVESRNRIWIGTWRDGLIRFDRNPDRFTTFKSIEGDPNSISHDFIYGLTRDSRGQIWVGTPNGVSRIVDAESGRFTRFLDGPWDFVMS